MTAKGNEVELTLFADSFGNLIFDPAKPVTQAESKENPGIPGDIPAKKISETAGRSTAGFRPMILALFFLAALL